MTVSTVCISSLLAPSATKRDCSAFNCRSLSVRSMSFIFNRAKACELKIEGTKLLRRLLLLYRRCCCEEREEGEEGEGEPGTVGLLMGVSPPPTPPVLLPPGVPAPPYLTLTTNLLPRSLFLLWVGSPRSEMEKADDAKILNLFNAVGRARTCGIRMRRVTCEKRRPTTLISSYLLLESQNNRPHVKQKYQQQRSL